jgi:hypothetical protein
LSPSEGSEKLLQIRTFSRPTVAATDDEGRTRPRFFTKLRSAPSAKSLQMRQLHHALHADPVAGKEGVAGTAAQAEHLDIERHRDERFRRVGVTGFVPR